MARARTRARVHDAVLSLVGEVGLAGLTMEGIAARAGAGKQTLYRTWPSTEAILLDALLAQSQDHEGQVQVPDTGDLRADLETLVAGIVDGLDDPVADRLLRAVTAEVQTSAALADLVRERLLGPQLRAVEDRLRRAGIADARDGAELLMGPILHRWLLRTRPFSRTWQHAHVDRVVRALTPTGGESGHTGS